MAERYFIVWTVAATAGRIRVDGTATFGCIILYHLLGWRRETEL